MNDIPGEYANSWREQQHSQDSSEESDVGTHSRRGSLTFERPLHRIPQYVLGMDSQQHNPESASGPERINETAELVRENEELRAAMVRLQEQMATLAANRAEEHPPVHPSPPVAANLAQSSLNDWILRQQLKKHAIPKLNGAIDYEAVLT